MNETSLALATQRIVPRLAPLPPVQRKLPVVDNPPVAILLRDLADVLGWAHAVLRYR